MENKGTNRPDEQRPLAMMPVIVHEMVESYYRRRERAHWVLHALETVVIVVLAVMVRQTLR